jgi:hypothetical protein
MFGAAERAEPFAVLDDALSQTLSDAGQLFEFTDTRRIDVDTLRDCLIGRGSKLGRIARLLIVRL